MQDFDTELPPPPPRSSDAPRVRLGLWLQVCPDPARRGTVLGLEHKVGLTVGRGADASVTIDDTWLSRQHFRVLLQAGAAADLGPWVVEDLGTRNGTFVNGHRIERQVVRHGDVVRQGPRSSCSTPASRPTTTVASSAPQRRSSASANRCGRWRPAVAPCTSLARQAWARRSWPARCMRARVAAGLGWG
jgi:hypothetical protein